MLRIEVVIVQDSGQVHGHLNFSLDEGPIDDEFRGLRQASSCRFIACGADEAIAGASAGPQHSAECDSCPQSGTAGNEHL